MAMNSFYAKNLLHEWPNQFIHPVCHCQTLVSKTPLHSTESIYSILYKIDNKRCCCALTILAVSSNNLDNLAHEQKKIYNEIYGLGGYITVYSSAAMETECHQSVT